MAITPNQITDVFQKQVGRAPTPYEIGKYSTASIQDLTGLKSTYAKYNPDQSLVDYLAFQGQDPTMKARSELASKYGISGYTGGFQQNVDLLSKLKSGQPTPAPSIPGSVTPTQIAPTQTTTPTETPGLSGTISGATQTPDSTQPPVVPEVNASKDAYTTAQKAVLDVTGRIDSINKTIDQALQNKRDEIARSGGVVDESQLRSTVLAESAPLLAERKDLLAQRSQLVGEQTIAGKAYQDSINAQKQSDANYFKSKQLEQGQQKIDLSETKMNVQEEQFAQKLEQSGWKSAKVNTYDSAGNVTGSKMIWSENPASISSDNKTQTTTTSSSGMSKTSGTAVGNVTNQNPPKMTLADGGTPDQVLKSLITGKPALYKGSTTPTTQQDLYNLAVLDMLGSTSSAGGRTPSGMIPLIKEKETQIMNAYGLTPFDVATARAQFKNMTSANLGLLQTASFMNVYAGSAKDYINLAIEQSALVPRTGAKIANKFSQWLAGNFTPAGNLAKLETYIYTAGREYAKVTTGGAKSSAELSITAQQKVDELINASQSPEVFKAVTEAMVQDMDKQVQNFDRKTSAFPDEVKALFGMASKAPELMRSSLPVGQEGNKQFVEKSLTRQGYHYDTLMKEMLQNAPEGTQPALKAETGETVYATQDDIKNGLAIPL